jgi:predicted amidohydrolase YtcJ
VLIRRVEIDGRAPLDVRIENGRIAAVAERLDARPGEHTIDGAGGVLLPGLHDHHIHLFALAAAEQSLRCGPPTVRDVEELRAALRAYAPGPQWVRGIAYHESVAGDLDRTRLDGLLSDRPLRIQHRSGAAWFLNSRAIELLGLDRGEDAEGVERGEHGRATGRLFRCDAWLAQRLDDTRVPSLAPVSSRLASYGVTGVTDATVHNDPEQMETFVQSAASGALLQRVVVMGTERLNHRETLGVTRGARKIVLDERNLPLPDGLVRTIADAHRAGRNVAIHCVTRVEAVLACAALRDAGVRTGDRIEHGAVAPPEIAALMAELRVTVVTQPGFVRERGDAYLIDVEPADVPWLYRCKGLLDAGVAVGGGTDAPYADADPWLAIRAAVDRKTLAGKELWTDERVTPERALALFTSSPEEPGGEPRAVAVGSTADLCLLDRPWKRARNELSSAMVRMAVRDGRVTWQR